MYSNLSDGKHLQGYAYARLLVHRRNIVLQVSVNTADAVLFECLQDKK